jgi:hypothetical protein
MQNYKLSKNAKINKEMIRNIVEEFARKMYYKLLFLKFLPEVKVVEEGKLKTIKKREIEKFFNKLINSK